MSPRFTVVNGPSGLPALSIENPHPKVRVFLNRIMRINDSHSDVYKLRTAAGAFLQSDHETYVLIEFWRPNHQPFVDWLNQQPLD